MLVVNRLVKYLHKSALRCYMVSMDMENSVPKLELPQFSNRVIAIEPTNFYFNAETAEDNYLSKNDLALIPEQIQEKVMSEGYITYYMELALKEWKNYTETLGDHGIEVLMYKQEIFEAYDSVWPDWFTVLKNEYIPEGVFILYPMKYPSRRKERLAYLIRDLKKQYTHFIDLTYFEQKGEFLEGKGSCVFDTRNRKIYCSISERSSLNVAHELVNVLNKISQEKWRIVSFHGKDSENKSIYHTDCMFAVFEKHIAVCLEAISDKEERLNLVQEITTRECNPRGQYELLELTLPQIPQMCANCFMLRKGNGELSIFMSNKAYHAYSHKHIQILMENYSLVVSDVSTLEEVGGGSCRCLLAELF